MDTRRIEFADAKDILVPAPIARTFIANATSIKKSQKIASVFGVFVMCERDTRKCLTAVPVTDKDSVDYGRFYVQFTDADGRNDFTACDALRIVTKTVNNVPRLSVSAIAFGRGMPAYYGSFVAEQTLMGDCIPETFSDDKEE